MGLSVLIVLEFLLWFSTSGQVLFNYVDLTVSKRNHSMSSLIISNSVEFRWKFILSAAGKKSLQREAIHSFDLFFTP